MSRIESINPISLVGESRVGFDQYAEGIADIHREGSRVQTGHPNHFLLPFLSVFIEHTVSK
ncbi:MAG: hypothetical protein JSR92_08300 [Proteobacteria bacterium]|nr:hypothetical protein [Pseudomonadota bacterium]